MKKWIWLFLMSYSGNFANAQNIIKTFSTELNANYSLLSNKVALSTKLAEEKPLDLNNRLRVNYIEMKEGDLVISYEVYAFPKLEQEMFLQLELLALDTLNKYIRFALPQHIGGISTINYAPIQQEKKIIWENWIEDFKSTNRFFQLKLIGHLTSPQSLNCTKPQWTKKQKLPHFIGTATGITSFLVGKILQKKSEGLQREYISLVEQGFPEDTNKKYSAANNFHKTANFFKTAGWITALASIVSGATRYLNFKKNKAKYDYYCTPTTPKVSFQPTLQLNGQVNDQIGFTLNYTF